MSVANAHAHAGPSDTLAHHTNTGVPNGKLGMWFFIASDAMGFIGLLAGYIVLKWANHDTWPEVKTLLSMELVALNTFILLVSSVTMVLALHHVRRGDTERCNLYILFTMFLGAVFVGFQAVEWTELIVHSGYTAQNSIFGASFFLLTGFHGFHVLCGVIYLSYMYVISALTSNEGAPLMNEQRTLPLEYTGLYWHFVDLVWIIIFTVIYLVD